MVVDCVYKMIITEETNEQGNTYTGYGIEAWDSSGAEQRRLHRVPDLFVSCTRCEQFVQMCNEEEVAPFHLLEVIDNILAKE